MPLIIPELVLGSEWGGDGAGFTFLDGLQLLESQADRSSVSCQPMAGHLVVAVHIETHFRESWSWKEHLS